MTDMVDRLGNTLEAGLGGFIDWGISRSERQYTILGTIFLAALAIGGFLYWYIYF